MHSRNVKIGKLPIKVFFYYSSFPRNVEKNCLDWLKSMRKEVETLRNFKAIHELVVAFNLVTFSTSLENILCKKSPKIKFLYSQVSYSINSILAFSIYLCRIKTDLSGNIV